MCESIKGHFLRGGVGIELGAETQTHKTGIVHDLWYGVKKEREELPRPLAV